MIRVSLERLVVSGDPGIPCWEQYSYFNAQTIRDAENRLREIYELASCEIVYASPAHNTFLVNGKDAVECKVSDNTFRARIIKDD